MVCLCHGVRKASTVAVLTSIFGVMGNVALSSAEEPASALPINVAALETGRKLPARGVRNLIALPQIRAAPRSGTNGLILDLSHVTGLLDGTTVDPSKIFGVAYVGPYPFEAMETRFTYKRLRIQSPIRDGRATLEVGKLFEARLNSEEWTDGGQVAVRLELYLERPGRDRALGVYDTFVWFCRSDDGFRKLPSIVEGPLVNMITSDDPARVIISFVTDEKVEPAILLDEDRRVTGRTARRHEITLTGLKPATEYAYRVQIGDRHTRPYRFRTAPAAGQGPVTFAYCGDSREGVGGGLHACMGVNFATLQRHAATSLSHGAEFLLMGGDLISGYTTSKADFEAQLCAWKQAISGYWHTHAVYPAMGNHEALLNVYAVPGKGLVGIDRWPYATHSVEAVFADALVNPDNGPTPADSRRPPYRENVFAFQYGLIKVIAFNNNYWLSSDPAAFGGSPEGYILEDQLRWIEGQLAEIEQDPTVKYVFLCAQEPMFPCGGHVADAMWYDGNNAVRAYSFRDDKLEPESHGILEVRNRLAHAVAASKKVVAVLAGDEHAYVRLLIDRRVPVGDPSRDDRNGDLRIDWRATEPPSPLADLKHPTWYITCGGGGAPYHAEEPTPWNRYWRAQDDTCTGYRYSSQENVVIFHADELRIGLRACNLFGEVIDEIPDLMAVKR